MSSCFVNFCEREYHTLKLPYKILLKLEHIVINFKKSEGKITGIFNYCFKIALDIITTYHRVKTCTQNTVIYS